jgi:hypothetical protein
VSSTCVGIRSVEIPRVTFRTHKNMVCCVSATSHRDSINGVHRDVKQFKISYRIAGDHIDIESFYRYRISLISIAPNYFQF